MGLDITAYSNARKLDALYNEDGEPVDPVTREPFEDGNVTTAYLNDDFPGRADEFTHKGVYAYDEAYGFRAGSYGGYNQWREQLAILAGYPAIQTTRFGGSVEMRHDAGAWAADAGPFYELIHFSDCEGVIGTAVAAKLLKDFDDNREKAVETGDDYFLSKYDEWRTAFELAAHDGFVAFH